MLQLVSSTIFNSNTVLIGEKITKQTNMDDHNEYEIMAIMT